MPITKPPVLPAWADAGEKVRPSDAELGIGWPLTTIPPSRQRFNWVLNFCANAVRYFSRRGLPDYDTAETYMTGDRVIGNDGKTYRSLVEDNTAQTPSTSPTKWERWGFTAPELGANAQTQPFTAFTTTGSSGAYVLTPAPAITGYAANQRFRVKFHAAGNGADTLNISGLGAKSIKQYDSAGAKVAAVIAANQLVDVEYDGVELVLLDSLPPSAASVQGAFKNLQASANGTNAIVNVFADEIVVADNSNTYKTLRGVSLSMNSAGAGANGLDTGSIAASTWYSLWVVFNPTTQASAGLLSLSATVPTMPSGYTYKARVGWIRTESTINKYPLPFRQYGRRVQYAPLAGSNLSTLPVMASGVAGTFNSSYVAVATGSFIPPTAAVINGILSVNGGGTNTTGAGVSSNQSNLLDAIRHSPNASLCALQFSLVLESSSIYWASGSANNYIGCSGWEDNL